MTTCGYCGVDFDEVAARTTCGACIVAEGCARARCPQCGFENPEEPRWVGAVRRWWARTVHREPTVATPTAGVMSLAALPVGQTAVVTDLDRSESARLRKLLALGIVPGVSLLVERRHPSIVFWMGRTQLAVDERMAASIYVSIRRAAGAPR